MKTDEPTCEIDSDGEKHWFLNGKCHRTDGPAIEYADGEKFWYLNGEEVNMYDVLPEKEAFWYGLNN